VDSSEDSDHWQALLKTMMTLPSPQNAGNFLTKTKLNSVALARERTMTTERPPLVGEMVPTFADRGCRVVSATDSHCR
jgi:hypothetical protein